MPPRIDVIDLQETPNSDAAYAALALLFKSRMEKEAGGKLFRTLASIALAHEQDWGGWFTKGNPLRHRELTARTISRIQPGELGNLIASINSGITAGRFFVSRQLRDALTGHEHCEPDAKIYAEHAVPLKILSRLVRRKIVPGASVDEIRSVLQCVLRNHLTIGWIVGGEQKGLPEACEVTCAAHCEVDRPCLAKYTANPPEHRKDYAADPHFSRYVGHTLFRNDAEVACEELAYPQPRP